VIGLARANFQGSAMTTVDFVVSKPSFLSKLLHYTGIVGPGATRAYPHRRLPIGNSRYLVR